MTAHYVTSPSNANSVYPSSTSSSTSFTVHRPNQSYTTSSLSSAPNPGPRYVQRTSTTPATHSADKIQESRAALVKFLGNLKEKKELDAETSIIGSKVQISSSSDRGQKKLEKGFLIFKGIFTKTVVEGKIFWELLVENFPLVQQRIELIESDIEEIEKLLTPKEFLSFITLDESLAKIVAKLNNQQDYLPSTKPIVLQGNSHVSIFLASDQDSFPLIEKAQKQGMGEVLPCISKDELYRLGIRLTNENFIKLCDKILKS